MIASSLPTRTPLPCLSEAAVQDALKKLLRSRPGQLLNDLEFLALVDEALLDETLPSSNDNRAYVLSELLISVITRELDKFRKSMGIVDAQLEYSYEEVQDAIAKDVSTGNVALLGWGWLYYHYVRIEFDISSTTFCRLASVVEETVRRYQRQAIRRLTLLLIKQEQCARKRSQQRRLYAQLPSMTPVALYGRTAMLALANEVSCHPARRHLQVIGADGIGKTAFVQEAIRSLVNADRVDQLVWIDAPRSVLDVHRSILNLLSMKRSSSSIRQWVQEQRCVFVLDGMDELYCQVESLRELLDDLSPAIVYLTSAMPLPLQSSMAWLVLEELEQFEAFQYIFVLLKAWHFPDYEQTSRNDVLAIWEKTKGNPRAIEAAVFELQSGRLRRD